MSLYMEHAVGKQMSLHMEHAVGKQMSLHMEHAVGNGTADSVYLFTLTSCKQKYRNPSIC